MLEFVRRALMNSILMAHPRPNVLFPFAAAAIYLLVKANEFSAVLEEAVANFTNFVKWLDFFHATTDAAAGDEQALCVWCTQARGQGWIHIRSVLTSPPGLPFQEARR